MHNKSKIINTILMTIASIFIFTCMLLLSLSWYNSNTVTMPNEELEHIKLIGQYSIDGSEYKDLANYKDIFIRSKSIIHIKAHLPKH